MVGAASRGAGPPYRDGSFAPEEAKGHTIDAGGHERGGLVFGTGDEQSRRAQHRAARA